MRAAVAPIVFLLGGCGLLPDQVGVACRGSSEIVSTVPVKTIPISYEADFVFRKDAAFEITRYPTGASRVSPLCLYGGTCKIDISDSRITVDSRHVEQSRGVSFTRKGVLMLDRETGRLVSKVMTTTSGAKYGDRTYGVAEDLNCLKADVDWPDEQSWLKPSQGTTR